MKRLFVFSVMVLLMAAAERSARADHDTAPERREMREVRSHAKRLEDRAEDLLREVERNRPRNQHGPDRALDLVRRFHADALAFYEVVDDNERYPERTLTAYRRMHSSYDRLSHRAEQVHLKPRVGRHLERIDESVALIDGYYRRSAPERIDWQRVAWLAHEIETLSDRVHSQAYAELTRRAHPQYDWRSREILSRLAELRAAADNFHDEVEEGRPSLVRVRADYDRLYAAQQRASSHIWSLEYRTRNDFYRLTDYMHEVRTRCFGREGGDRYFSPGSRLGTPSSWESRSAAPTPLPGRAIQGLLVTLSGAEIR